MSTEQRNIPTYTVKVSFLQIVAREAYQTYIGDNFQHHHPFLNGYAYSLMNAMDKDAANNLQGQTGH